MDAVSTAIGFVTTGIQVVQFIRKTLDDIKSAPAQLEALSDCVADIEYSFEELRRMRQQNLFFEQRDLDVLERRNQGVQKYLTKIEEFQTAVEKIEDDGAKKVKKVKWLMKGSRLAELTKDAGELQAALQGIITLAVLRRQEHMYTVTQNIGGDVQVLHATIEAARLSNRAASTRLLPSRTEETFVSGKHCRLPHSMHCEDGCGCRCHSVKSKQIVPAAFTSYIGKMNVPRQLFDDIRWSPSTECHVRTCRRCRTGPPRITVHLPPALGFFDIHIPHISFGRLPFGLSIHAPRLVPVGAKVCRAIAFSDLDGLRALFEAREASVYDVDPDGATLLRWACDTWANERTEESLNVVKFLAEAGADPEFSLDRRFSLQLYLFNFSLNTLHEHPATSFAHQVKASSLAIDVCHTLGLDIDDVVEEGLISCGASERTVKLLTQPPEMNGSLSDSKAFNRQERAFNWQERAFNWQEIGYHRLQHAMLHSSPDVVLQLLEQGEDASTCPSLADAAWKNLPELIKPLLDAGARVNHHNQFGMTALHILARDLRLPFLQTLTELAGDDHIHWLARTPQGKTALHLAKESAALIYRTHDELDAIFSILCPHIPNDEDEPDEDELDEQVLEMPGAFPTCAPPPA